MNQDPDYRQFVVEAFLRGGYMRSPNAERRKDGPKYHKGYELRFVRLTPLGLTILRRNLEKVGFKPGKPYQQNSRWVQPVYGKKPMDQMKEWLDLE